MSFLSYVPPEERPLECTIRPGEVSPALAPCPPHPAVKHRAAPLPTSPPPPAPPGTPAVLSLQVLYFPDRWWHATLNLDTSVFISTFLG